MIDLRFLRFHLNLTLMFNHMIYCNGCQSVTEIKTQAVKYKLIQGKQYWSELDKVAPMMTGPPRSNSTALQNQPIAAFQRS